MLEQAIIDAEALKEAALKNAESAIIEKYSHEIKKTMNSLLEQPEDPGMEPEAELGAELGTEFGDELEDESEGDPFEELPDLSRADTDDTSLSNASDGQVVDINLTKLAEELKSELPDEELEESAEGEEEELEEKRRYKDRLEGHPTGPNRERLEEDLDLDDLDDDLLNSIIEKLTVDVKNVPTGQAGGASNETLDKENADIALAKEDLEELEEDEEKKELEESVKKLKKDKKTLLEQNKKFKNMILQLKEKVEEVNLSNAKLLYTNRILDSASLNERQRNKIVDALSNADSVEEAKVIYETLQSAVGSSRKRIPKSLSEVVQRSSTTLPRRNSETKTLDPVTDRWKILAGINKDR